MREHQDIPSHDLGLPVIDEGGPPPWSPRRHRCRGRWYFPPIRPMASTSSSTTNGSTHLRPRPSPFATAPTTSNDVSTSPAATRSTVDRSGGHGYGGYSSGKGVVVDVSNLAQIEVDTGARLRRWGGGAAHRPVLDARERRIPRAGGIVPDGGDRGARPRRRRRRVRPQLRPHVRQRDGPRGGHGRRRCAPMRAQPRRRPLLGVSGWWGRELRGGHLVHLRPPPHSRAVALFTLDWPAEAAADVLGAWAELDLDHA